jgi:hypothetical protein
MLTKDQIIPFLLDKCPEFEPVWQEHQQGVTAGCGIYIDVAEFVDLLVDSYELGKLNFLPRAFETVEALFVEGDSDVKQVAMLGILETLQCAASWKPFGNKVFVPWLGPQSREAWNLVVEMWSGKSSLADVIRAENEQGRE